MKKVLILLALCCSVLANAQSNTASQVGKIALNPYVQEDEPVGAKTKELLITKLNQVVTQNGCAGDGFDSRFIVTAHLQALDEAMTTTVPAKIAVRLSCTVYIGDGLNGTLFSSYNMELKGVGDTKDGAWMAAIRKISPRDPGLVSSVEEGKSKIVQYYNQVGPSIVAKAQAAAKGGNYDEAISELMAIPASSSSYSQAQSLIGQYGKVAADRANLQIISEARAAWASSPDESGASRAESILNKLDNPSPEVLSQANALSKEMSSRLKAVSDREYRLRVQQQTDETKVRIATVNAAARVARAYYNSRPRVVYHVHWW